MRQTEEDLLGFSLAEPPITEEFAPPEDKPAPYFRADRFNMETMTDAKKMILWMNRMKDAPLEGIDDTIVNQSYTAMVWLFRKSAAEGDLKATSAIEKWLAWAKPIIQKPKLTDKPKPSKGSIAFLPREPQSGESPEQE